MAGKKNKIKKSAKKAEGITLTAKYLLLTFAVSLITYLAYYLKFPNIWATIISLGFFTLIIANFKKIKGFEIIIYFIIWNIITLPLFAFLMEATLVNKIIIFAANLAFYLLIINGLKRLESWILYVLIIVFILSLISILSVFFVFLKDFVFDLRNIIFFAKNMFLSLFLVISIIYSLREIVERKYFNKD